MRFNFNLPNAAWSAVAFAAVLVTAIVTGCDSRPNINDPAVQKGLQAQREVIQKSEDAANRILQKRGGKNAAVVKSIKGGIGAGSPDSQ
jgi:hypothetical protein